MVCQVSPSCRSAPPFTYPGLQSSGCPPPGLTGPQCPGLPAPPPSTLQAQRLGPTSCHRRGPLRGLPRSPQRWHPGPGAHNGPRPSTPQPLPSRTPVCPRHPTPACRGLRGAPSVLPADPPWGSGDPLPGWAGLGALSSAARLAYRAPSRRTFSGEVSPGPEGGRRFS